MKKDPQRFYEMGKEMGLFHSEEKPFRLPV